MYNYYKWDLSNHIFPVIFLQSFFFMNLTLQFWKKCHISTQSACWLKEESKVVWCQPLTKNLNWLSDLVSTETPRFAKSFRSDSIPTFKMTVKFFKNLSRFLLKQNEFYRDTVSNAVTQFYHIFCLLWAEFQL